MVAWEMGRVAKYLGKFNLVNMVVYLVWQGARTCYDGGDAQHVQHEDQDQGLQSPGGGQDDGGDGVAQGTDDDQGGWRACLRCLDEDQGQEVQSPGGGQEDGCDGVAQGTDDDQGEWWASLRCPDTQERIPKRLMFLWSLLEVVMMRLLGMLMVNTMKTTPLYCTGWEGPRAKSYCAGGQAGHSKIQKRWTASSWDQELLCQVGNKQRGWWDF